MIRTQDLKILVVGVVRNGEKTLRNDIFRLKESLSSFKSVSWYIVESDSIDNTKYQLESLSKLVSDFSYISLGNLSDTIQRRTERIAYCRNVYIDKINSKEGADIDYVIVSDLDGLNAEITQRALLTCWEHDGWSACMANQRGPYYDIYALRHKFLSPNNLEDHYSFLLNIGISQYDAINSAIYSRMIRIPESTELLEVDSAFGGLAVYKKNIFINNKYKGVDAQNNAICEHVVFHESARKNGHRLYINTRMINANFTEHTKNLRLIHSLFFFVTNAIKKIMHKLGIKWM